MQPLWRQNDLICAGEVVARFPFSIPSIAFAAGFQPPRTSCPFVSAHASAASPTWSWLVPALRVIVPSEPWLSSRISSSTWRASALPLALTSLLSTRAWRRAPPFRLSQPWPSRFPIPCVRRSEEMTNSWFAFVREDYLSEFLPPASGERYHIPKSCRTELVPRRSLLERQPF